jgi:hypothetical protein
MTAFCNRDNLKITTGANITRIGNKLSAHIRKRQAQYKKTYTIEFQIIIS